MKLFSTDLDGTLLGDPFASERFTETWTALPRAVRPLLVYNTGRTVENMRQLIAARHLPEPDHMIGSIGTELNSGDKPWAEDFVRRLSLGWSLARVQNLVRTLPKVQPQPPEFGHRFKSSWYWDRASAREIDDLRQRLGAAGVDAHVDYSVQRFLDVVPARAGKGNALAWLCHRLDIPLHETLVAGDTGNDASMFLLPGVHGILVGNALPELRRAVKLRQVFSARAELADGVLEGLRHFAVTPPGLAVAG